MAIIDIFKSASVSEARKMKRSFIAQKKKKEKEKHEKAKEVKDKKEEGFYPSMILKAAHVTEKAGDLAGKNQYIFKVYSEANKIKIKKAIENIFKIDVTSVKIINISKRKRKLGKISGWKKGYKKAIVAIKKDQKIDILPR